MADDFLGRKMEEYFAKKSAPQKRYKVSLKSLLAKNRSHRAYDASFKVREEQLRDIVDVCRLTPSARNQQVLRFRLVLGEEAQSLLPHIRLGGALPDMHFPPEGKEPNAFIVICSEQSGRFVDIDAGIVTQTMLLRAVELGLNGICIASFNKERIVEILNLPMSPLLILAIGRGAEHIELVDIGAEESRNYYRRGESHIVPKLRTEELIIK
ncbi:MAG: nitroreductase family protein [Alistipes sp.]|nr:nitroreductase family protein [Alistipes sp.]